jgi:hypothetical protein
VLNNPAVQTDINMASHKLTNVGATGGMELLVDANGTVTNVLPTNFPTGQLLVNGVPYVPLVIGTNVQAWDADLDKWALTTPPTTYAIGDVLFASGANTISKLADVATSNVLISGGVATAPSYGKVTSAHVDSSIVPSTRTVSTTSPLSGGGDLSANRTIAIADAAADGSTKGAATFTAADFNATAGNISLDYTNGQAATGSVKGFLTAADWTTFNGKESALTFSTGLTRSTNTITVNTAQNIATLSNLTGNGFVKTSGGTGALSIDTSTYLTTDTKWDGGATGLTASTGRTSLGATTVGGNIFTLTNPSAISFIEIAADNSVSTKSASQMRTDLGLAIGTNVQAWDTDLDTWATKTPYAGTLTITTGKTANITNTITLSGTDSTTMTFPTTTATIARIDAAQSFTGLQTFASATGINISGFNTSNSQFKVGTFEAQSYALNNGWFGDNIYYDGSNFKNRATGTSAMFYFNNDEINFRNYTSSTAGTTLAQTSVAKISPTGAGFGSAIVINTDVFTGSRFYVDYATAVNTQFYDASNYYTSTVSSTGGVTFDAVGSGAGFTFSDKVTHTLPTKLKNYTVSTLPAGSEGDWAYVTDATAPTYNAALTGGGAVKVPVFYNGSAWVSH